MPGATYLLSEGALVGTDFRVVRPLAQGGMGSVYIVDQLSTGKARALKLMRPELAEDEDARKRFVLEAKVGSRIKSDHVVEVLSAGVDDATRAPYLVMELLEGEDLAMRIARGGPLSLAEARETFEQLCHAVGEAHAAGIVHRDLKPENIYLARSRRAGERGRASVKVLDFGIAKLVAESGASAHTMGMIGTPLWMAPEQTEKGKPTPAADVWALGLILYFCLTGRSYWRTGQDPEATFSMILREVLVGPLPTPSRRAGEDRCPERVPRAIDPVFARAVARAPADRYPDAEAFWAALQAALDTVVAQAPSSQRIVVPAVPPSSRALLEGPRPLYAPPESTPRFPWWALPLGLVVVLGVMISTCNRVVRGVAARKGTQTPVAAPVDTNSGATGAPWAPGGGGVAVAGKITPCRLCSGEVVVTGGSLTREAVVSAIESNFARVDNECLTTRGRSRPKAGTMTVSFVVRSGRMSKRAIERSTVPDETDKCVSAALSEVTFPVVADESAVQYSLRFDPARR